MGKKVKSNDEPLYLANALFPKPMFAAVLTTGPGVPSVEKQNPIHTALVQAGKLAVGQFGYELKTRKSDIIDPTADNVDIGDTEQESQDLYLEESTNPRHRVSTAQYDTIGDDSLSETGSNDGDPGLKEPHFSDDVEEAVEYPLETQKSLQSLPSELSVEKDTDQHLYTEVSKTSESRSPGEMAFNRKSSDATGNGDIDRLRKENWSLQEQVRDIISQLREMQPEREEKDLIIREREATIEKLNTYIKSLERERAQYLEDIRELREKNERLRGGSGQYSRDDNSDGSEVNEALGQIIADLNAELSRYQQKYRTPLTEDDRGVPIQDNCPPWLTNFKYLSPLLLAYDDRINEKDGMINLHERDLSLMKTKIEEIVKENQQLHIENSNTVKHMEWEHLQEQAKLVLEENQILMEEVEVLQKKCREQHSAHVNELSRLTRKIITSDADKAQAEGDFAQLQVKFQQLRKQYDSDVIGSDDKISVAKHNKLINDLKQQMDDQNDAAKIDIENLLVKLTQSDIENQSLMKEKMEYHSDMNNLQEEVKSILKMQRKWQKKAVVLEKKLMYAEEKASMASGQLETALNCAEQATEERDGIASLMNTQVDMKNKTISDLQGKQFTETDVQEKLLLYKTQLKNKTKKQALMLSEKIKDYENRQSYYVDEIDSLQKLLQAEKQKSSSLLENKHSLESSFDALWRSAKEEDIP